MTDAKTTIQDARNILATLTAARTAGPYVVRHGLPWSLWPANHDTWTDKQVARNVEGGDALLIAFATNPELLDGLDDVLTAGLDDSVAADMRIAAHRLATTIVRQAEELHIEPVVTA